MKLNKRLTPYPVLTQDGDDYVDSYFDASVKNKIEFGKLILDTEFFLNDGGLQEKINNSEAIFAVHIECSSMCFRNMMCDNKICTNVIDLSDITDKLEISTFIVANVDIKDYSNDKFNWEYGNNIFQIAKGNILAIGPTFSVDIDRKKDGLKKLTDIIAIKQQDSAIVQEITVGIEQDIIYIYVTENVKNLYFLHGRNYLHTVISMIMVPAMEYVLTQISSNSQNYSDFKWYKVIEKLLKQNGVDVDALDAYAGTGKNSIYVLAQKIFKTPMEMGLRELNAENKVD